MAVSTEKINGSSFKEVFLALSLGNLLLIGSWRDLLFPRVSFYHVKEGPSATDYVGVMLTVVLVASAIYGVRHLIKLSSHRRAALLADLLTLLLFVYILNLFLIQLDSIKEIQTVSTAINVGTALMLVVALTRIGKYLIGGITALILLVAPFTLFTFFQAAGGAWAKTVRAESFSEITAADSGPSDKPALSGRVVWVIFDEFDYRIPFELNAADLPEFNRLRSEALFATSAVSPARYTLEAIPSLLTGSVVTEATPTGPATLQVQFSEGRTADLAREETIFSAVKRKNGNAGAVGYYHPYCRVFAKDLAKCEWENNVFNENPPFEPSQSLIGAMRRDIQNLFAPVLFSVAPHLHYAYGYTDRRLEAITDAHTSRGDSMVEMATDPGLDLVFLHIPYPHPPAQWNAATGEFVPDRRDYVENLKLADIVLGKLRAALEDAGQWDSTAILISSDHPLRVSLWKDDTCCLTPNDRVLTSEIEDERIPFILKMPGQTFGVEYGDRLNSVVSHGLILSILEGRTRSADDAVRWLNRY